MRITWNVGPEVQAEGDKAWGTSEDGRVFAVVQVDPPEGYPTDAFRIWEEGDVVEECGTSCTVFQAMISVESLFSAEAK